MVICVALFNSSPTQRVTICKHIHPVQVARVITKLQLQLLLCMNSEISQNLRHRRA